MSRQLVWKSLLPVLLLAFASVRIEAQNTTPLSHLEFRSSDAALNASFAWAKQQALAYVRSGKNSIGPWYEAALPGRNAFCMRDVSHQTTGAAALGLYEANRNMLTRFALSAAPSRNWAGYWEIDGKGQPSSADYRSDDDFWFNLPANFDVLDAMVRMWRWTGDDGYRDDPRLRTFYRKTLTEYISQWQLEPGTMLKRPRIVNQRLENGQFVNARGIPSYTEGTKDFILGSDLLAAEYRAIRSYQEIAATPSDRQLADRLEHTAIAILDLLDRFAWSPKENHFYGVIQRDLHGYGSADTMILYFGAIKNEEHLRGALNYVADPSYWKMINIEEESYVPQVLFRYGRSEAAYRILLNLSDPKKPRREYPEVSFAVIAAIVSGAMGIEPARRGAGYDLQSLPQPLEKDDNLSIASLPIRGNILDLDQHGDSMQRLINRNGPAVRWRAEFNGTQDTLQVDGSPVSATHATLPGGRQISWATVVVPPGASVSVTR